MEKKIMKEENKKIPSGLEQKIKVKSEDGKSNKLIKLIDILSPEDVWETSGRIKRTIITHNGVKKIANKAGVDKNVKYEVLTQPTAMNNYQYTIAVTICKGKECVTEIGEANRNNLGRMGRNNPANMAQKRGFDRAVFALLEISGMLSEEELPDEDNEKKEMELEPDQNKIIAPIINQLISAKSSRELIVFSDKMKKIAPTLEEKTLEYVRKFYLKRAAELKSVTF